MPKARAGTKGKVVDANVDQAVVIAGQSFMFPLTVVQLHDKVSEGVRQFGGLLAKQKKDLLPAFKEYYEAFEHAWTSGKRGMQLAAIQYLDSTVPSNAAPNAENPIGYKGHPTYDACQYLLRAWRRKSEADRRREAQENALSQGGETARQVQLDRANEEAEGSRKKPTFQFARLLLTLYQVVPESERQALILGISDEFRWTEATRRNIERNMGLVNPLFQAKVDSKGLHLFKQPLVYGVKVEGAGMAAEEVRERVRAHRKSHAA
jgi:hypothetical protein